VTLTINHVDSAQDDGNRRINSSSHSGSWNAQ